MKPPTEPPTRGVKIALYIIGGVVLLILAPLVYGLVSALWRWVL